MKAKATDRRVQRTQQMLHEALIALIIEKGYEAVTVQDIIDRANVGRSTFYAHFWDKEQLLMSGLEKLRNSFEAQYQRLIVENDGRNEHRLEIGLSLFQHAEQHRALYKALVGKQSGLLIARQVHQYMTEMLRDHLGVIIRANSNFEVPLEITVQAVTGTLLGLLVWWLDHDLPYSAEDMNRWFYQLAFQPLLSNEMNFLVNL